MSQGTLPLIPENVFYAKQKLTRQLKREPTNEELAAHLNMHPKELNDILKMKTEYNENTLSPSFESGPDVYYGSPLQRDRKVPLFLDPNRYDRRGGKKCQRKCKKRTHTKKYKKTKTTIYHRKSNKKSMKNHYLYNLHFQQKT